MARGVTLGALITDLREELQQSTSPSLGQSYRATLRQKLQTTQEWLWDEFTWPFLRLRENVSLQAGSRYYSFPANAPLEAIKAIKVKYSGRWLPVSRGITMDDYATHDSDLDERTDPVQKWDVLHTGSVEQIEVWPLPATNGTNNLRIFAQKPLAPFISDSAVCTLDSRLLLWFTASDILTKSNPEESKRFLGKGTKLLSTLQGRTSDSTPLNFASGRRSTRAGRTPLVARAAI